MRPLFLLLRFRWFTLIRDLRRSVCSMLGGQELWEQPIAPFGSVDMQGLKQCIHGNDHHYLEIQCRSGQGGPATRFMHPFLAQNSERATLL